MHDLEKAAKDVKIWAETRAEPVNERERVRGLWGLLITHRTS